MGLRRFSLHSKITRLLCLAVLILILIIACATAYFSCLFKPMLREGRSPFFVQIEPNTSALKLISQLNDLRVVSSHGPLLVYMRTYGYTQRLKAGVYQVTETDTLYRFIRRIVAGDVVIESFKIIEGTTLKDLKRHLATAPFLQFQEADLSAFNHGYFSPEGLFLAETYQYQAPSRAEVILKTANHLLMDYLNRAYETKDPGLPYKNPYELLIAASILEKETAILEERKIISGIIVNRLRLHMPLQMDPTLIYGLHKAYGQRLTRDDISLDTPYNTYKRRGLPPTPIAFVGKASIDAAAHPQKTFYLYYVAKGDGSHQFSKTYEEQRITIQRLKTGNAF